jgi:hypothetical protein
MKPVEGGQHLLFHPQSEVARAVAAAPREIGSASNQTVTEETNSVKDEIKYSREVNPKIE